ncbi:MAG: hypothetical protein JRG97_10060 [Deltaproteobacteria bacterium]|nr:hypothetical protein [Deltaproteobacteria bacterium]MBW2051116.1 hypothetical protein [Deltaproteobacteria bacterium]MBW2141398.1 hypothetical protein [Deltaproteobacteria bacterium]MBW2322871.1 hypothetical protein [Deltaproteobacteria bacterium]
MAKREKEFEISVAEVVDYLRITGEFSPALREVVQRKITADAARKAKMKVTAKQLQKAADAFRIAHGLNKARDTNKWLKEKGISLEALEEYLETNLLIDKFKDALNKKVAKRKYLETQAIKETVREMIYQDWIKKEMK